CFGVMLNLLRFPVFGAAIRDASLAAVESVSYVESGLAMAWRRAVAPIFKHKVRQVTAQDRTAAVQGLRVAPSHLVAYQNQKVSFSALPTDIAGQVAQGAKMTWDTSNHQIASADFQGESGIVSCHSPGLVWVTCTAGNANGRAPLLVLPGNRPNQTFAQWMADQN